MSGRRAAAGWARRGHAALSLEVSARERTRGKLQRRRAACVCARVLRSDSALCSARVTEITSRAEADPVCDDLCRIFCSHRAALRAAEMDGRWERGGEEGVISRSGFRSRVVM